MIYPNLTNPIPIHKSKNQWYCNRVTNKGCCTNIYAPLGKILPFQLTLDDVNYTIKISTLGQPTEVGNFAVTGTYQYDMQEGRFVIDSRPDKYSIWIGEADSDGECAVQMSFGMVCSEGTCAQGTVTQAEIDEGIGVLRVSFGGNSYEIEFFGYTAKYPSFPDTDTIINLYRKVNGSDDELVRDITNLLTENIAVSDNTFSVMLGGVYVNNMNDEGVYYLSITNGGREYYSEPWKWIKEETIEKEFTKIEYTTPNIIDTDGNILNFTQNGELRYMEMYLHGHLMMPEYMYEENNTPNDGFMFSNKKVSFVSQKLRTFTTEYMAMAIGLMWHCANIIVTDCNIRKTIDYMDAPEIAWDNSNDMCSVTLSFRSGTIIQTYGAPVNEYYQPPRKRNSFNKDYNEDYR